MHKQAACLCTPRLAMVNSHCASINTAALLRLYTLALKENLASVWEDDEELQHAFRRLLVCRRIETDQNSSPPAAPWDGLDLVDRMIPGQPTTGEGWVIRAWWWCILRVRLPLSRIAPSRHHARLPLLGDQRFFLRIVCTSGR